MDNQKFGSFIAELRKERNMTQKELADQLHVTDKAVSKWETGKGFPDIKLMDDLAKALDVSLVDLIQCSRRDADTLSPSTVEKVVSQAMDQSQKITTRKYLRLFRWFLFAAALVSSFSLCLNLYIRYISFAPLSFDVSGIIGGADGPTSILVSSALPSYFEIVIQAIFALLCIILAIRVNRQEKTLT